MFSRKLPDLHNWLLLSLPAFNLCMWWCLLFLSFLWSFLTGMTGFSSHGSFVFLDAVFVCWAARLSVCVWVYTVLFCRSCGSCFTCAETITTSFLGHKCDFSWFLDFYTVFLLCLNFNFYGSCDLLLCFGDSLEVVGVGKLKFWVWPWWGGYTASLKFRQTWISCLWCLRGCMTRKWWDWWWPAICLLPICGLVFCRVIRLGLDFLLSFIAWLWTINCIFC